MRVQGPGPGPPHTASMLFPESRLQHLCLSAVVSFCCETSLTLYLCDLELTMKAQASPKLVVLLLHELPQCHDDRSELPLIPHCAANPHSLGATTFSV